MTGSRSHPRNGFKPNGPQKAPRKPRKKAPMYPWTQDLKVLGWNIALETHSEEDMVLRRKFPKAQRLYDRILQEAPWLKEDYLHVTGEPFTPSIIYQRIHKKYYRNDVPHAKRAQYSSEHPANNEQLRKKIKGPL